MVGNDESIGTLGSEIRTLCMRVGRVLGADYEDKSGRSDDMQVEGLGPEESASDDAVFDNLRYETCYFDGISSYLGCTLEELIEKSKFGFILPEIKNVIDFSVSGLPTSFTGRNGLPKSFTGLRMFPVSLSKGELIFLNNGENYVLLQVLDKYVTFSTNTIGGLVSSIPVRLYEGHGRYFRRYLSSDQFFCTGGIAYKPAVSSDEYFFSTVTFVHCIQAEILQSARKRRTYDKAINSRGKTEYNLKNIARYLNNVKTGSHTFFVERDIFTADFTMNFLQIVLNCLIVVSHWIRYDLSYNGKGSSDDPFFRNKCMVIAFSKLSDESYVSVPQDVLGGSQKMGNLFSLESCINDWKYLFIQRIEICKDESQKESHLLDFKREIVQLLQFNSLLKTKRYIDSFRNFVDYVINGRNPPMTRDHAFEFISEAFDMAIQKAMNSLYTSFTDEMEFENLSVDDFIFNRYGINANFQTIEHLTNDLNKDTCQNIPEIMTSLYANSYEIEHMSCLQQNDLILVDNNVVASVVELSFVDPFLSVYNQLINESPWRHVISLGRLQEDQADESSRISLEYMTERMKAVLVLLPDDKAGVALEEQPPPPKPKFFRDSRFFSVLSIQLTYRVHGKFEPDDTLHIQTTLDFTRIRLLGICRRKVAASIVNKFDDSEAIQVRCGICGESKFKSPWRHSRLCCHIYHETCLTRYHDPSRCPVCFRSTDLQRKGAAA